MSQGHSEEALKTWRKGLEKIPASVPLNLDLASTLLQLGRIEEAARVDKSRGQEGPLEVLESLVARLSSIIEPEFFAA